MLEYMYIVKLCQTQSIEGQSSQQVNNTLWGHVSAAICNYSGVADDNLTASISLASVQSSISRNTSVSVSQLTGVFPLPLAHSRRISLLIRSASPLCLCSMLVTLAPLWSSRRKTPKSWYLMPISCGMLILLSLP